MTHWPGPLLLCDADAVRCGHNACMTQESRKPKRVQRYNADGEKERYFADDDNVDLATLVKRAKYGDDVPDMDHAVADNIRRNARCVQLDAYHALRLADVLQRPELDAGVEPYMIHQYIIHTAAATTCISPAWRCLPA